MLSTIILPQATAPNRHHAHRYLLLLLQELGKSNPQMLQLINNHQSDFIALLESGEGGGFDEGEEEEGAHVNSYPNPNLSPSPNP